MKNKLAILIVISLLLSACSLNPFSSNNNVTGESKKGTNISLISNTPTPVSSISNDLNSNFVGLKTNNGTIVLKLFSSQAPNTVANFLTKVNSGFYNGLTFHRVLVDFMAQGGDPLGTGSGGGQIKSEINNIPFKRGSLGLARLPGNKETSNDSQFFICFTTEGCSHLTGDYVNFGEVISGLEVLDQIKQGDKIIEITQNTK